MQLTSFDFLSTVSLKVLKSTSLFPNSLIHLKNVRVNNFLVVQVNFSYKSVSDRFRLFDGSDSDGSSLMVRFFPPSVNLKSVSVLASSVKKSNYVHHKKS